MLHIIARPRARYEYGKLNVAEFSQVRENKAARHLARMLLQHTINLSGNFKNMTYLASFKTSKDYVATSIFSEQPQFGLDEAITQLQ